MQLIRNNLATIVTGVVVAVVIAASFVLLGPWRTSSQGELVAVVHSDDGTVQRLPLSKDTTLEVSTSLGRNVITVENGAARIAEADCPKGSCVQQQPISRPGQQLICLPHKLWVVIVVDGDDSAGFDADAAELDPDAVSWNERADVDLVTR